MVDVCEGNGSSLTVGGVLVGVNLTNDEVLLSLEHYFCRHVSVTNGCPLCNKFFEK